MTNIHAQKLGKLGGKSKSQKKILAARINMAKAREKRWVKTILK